MLEARNLTKIYKSKGGVEVKALDGVNIRFPEKGMVFLLGKSGSGKSTLLNVCGGLDNPTDGEIIVKDRSSKDFSQSDFDSYRNTFIGFIFQEYNILNEFSVEDNIALALELQGKPKDKVAVQKLLEQVDMQGYAKRKPNTLSGGQKQRIAIARALIKNPEIIMADEPTGALDSTTGKQVFDTLKKLSETKLVIVVSHDREFAETYADRIVELKDGKIISDVSKVCVAASEISENVKVVGEKTIQIKNSENLTDEDFDKVKEFLKKNGGETIITTGNSEVKNFKRVSKISDDGNQETFENTEEQEKTKTYTLEESKFIRSKLPIRHAAKIGVSGLKVKPFRLIFTIILATISFIMFGMASTLMTYDGDTAFARSLELSSVGSMRYQKQYEVTQNYYEKDELIDTYKYNNDTKFTPDEVKTMAEKYGDKTFGALEERWDVSNIYEESEFCYYVTDINYVSCVPDGHYYSNSSNLVAGYYPTKDAVQPEIMISDFTANSILKTGLKNPDTDAKYEITNVNSLHGKKLRVGGVNFTVSGIFEGDRISQKYDVLKETKPGTSEYYENFSYFESALRSDGNNLVCFVSEDTFEKLTTEYVGDKDYVLFKKCFDWDHIFTAWHVLNGVSSRESRNYGYTQFNFSSLSKTNILTRTFADSAKTGLATDEILLSYKGYMENVLNVLVEIYSNSEAYSSVFDKLFSDTVYTLGGVDYTVHTLVNKVFEVIGDGSVGKDKLGEMAWVVYNKTRECLGELQVDAVFEDREGEIAAPKKYKVVGMFDLSSYPNCAIVSDEEFARLHDRFISVRGYGDWHWETETKYEVPEDAVFEYLFVPYNHTRTTTDNMVAETVKRADDSSYAISNSISNTFGLINEFVGMGKKIFLIVGIVLAVFAALLLTNFISVSITYKKREIGILRAVGARSVDVFKIFFSESFTITLICIVLSLIGTGITCAGVNAELCSGIGVSLFNIGFISVASLIAIAIVTAVVATFLPVFFAARKKPVDSIRAL